jgi:hypothetical protein
LWESFATGYEEEAALILKDASEIERKLPHIFLDACVRMQKVLNEQKKGAEARILANDYAEGE